jgi:predicted DsbA family dithiol-disulfide isomerase
MTASAIPVDVWADVTDPWCYVGQHRLGEAIAAEPAGAVVIRPRAFELHPGVPPEGMSTEDFYPRRFTTADALRDELERSAGEAAASGLELRYDRITRIPNTRIAHRLVALAARRGRGREALMALFAAHFRDGAGVGDARQAAELVAAAAPGLDAAALLTALDAGEGEREVAAEEGLADRMGITRVPFFLAGRGVALAGLHDTVTYAQLIAAARQRVEAEAGADEPPG